MRQGDMVFDRVNLLVWKLGKSRHGLHENVVQHSHLKRECYDMVTKCIMSALRKMEWLLFMNEQSAAFSPLSHAWYDTTKLRDKKRTR